MKKVIILIEMKSASNIPDPNVLQRKMTSFILGTVQWFASMMYEHEAQGAKGYFHEPIALPVSA